MERCTYEEAKRIVSKYQSQIEEIKYDINKNFADMDLSNSTIQQQMEEIVNEMITQCNKFSNEISDYRFK